MFILLTAGQQSRRGGGNAPVQKADCTFGSHQEAPREAQVSKKLASQHVLTSQHLLSAYCMLTVLKDSRSPY